MDRALRPHHHPSPSLHGVAGGREDCWSEGATEALVEAWGDRYVQLGRGNLRQKDWQEVADAVNDHQDALSRPRRTDVQCKNRIDTLKKKYKSEKAKRPPSLWPLFSRIDHLLSPDPARKPASPLPSPLAHKLKSNAPKPSPDSSESSRGENGAHFPGENENDDEDEEENGRRMFRVAEASGGTKRRWEGVPAGGSDSGGVDEAFGELANAIVKFGEIYERMEGLKQKQMMELESQRMEFAKELEFQRMQMFMEAQLELEKMKRPKYSAGAGKRS